MFARLLLGRMLGRAIALPLFSFAIGCAADIAGGSTYCQPKEEQQHSNQYCTEDACCNDTYSQQNQCKQDRTQCSGEQCV